MAPKASKGGRRQPQQDRAEATRTQILSVAAAAFGAAGIAEVPMSRIAADAGVSVGTLYRYFSDKSAIVAELTERLLEQIENDFTSRAFSLSISHDEATPEYAMSIAAEVLAVFATILETQAGLVNALIRSLQFPEAGLSEFEQRLRLLVKVILIQALGPRDDRYLDTATDLMINTGFAAVLRTAAQDIGAEQRREALETIARMIGVWIIAENSGTAR
ncbi:TetR/AcrR family transcriptional regulator [Nocardia thailandica]